MEVRWEADGVEGRLGVRGWVDADGIKKALRNILWMSSLIVKALELKRREMYLILAIYKIYEAMEYNIGCPSVWREV